MKFTVVIDVDIDILTDTFNQNKDEEANSDNNIEEIPEFNINNQIIAEFGWLNESGISLESIEELKN